MFFKKIGVIVLAAVVLLLTACAGGHTETESADSLQRVMDAGKLTVAGSGGYRPFNYIGEDGAVVGFDVDVGKEIASRMGVELNYVTGEWSGLIEGLRNYRYDAILGSMAITKTRLETVDFSVPYYYSGAQLVVRKDSGITGPEMLGDKTIAVVTGTNFEQDVLDIGATPKLYDDDNATILELISGRVDGVITDKVVALESIREIQGGDALMLAGDVIRLEEMGIALNKKDTKLKEKMNQILAEMHEDGTLSAISKKWQGGVDITKK